jgi:hypothetical protein
LRCVEGILKTVRGPGGGYVLAREQRRFESKVDEREGAE